MQEWDYCVPKGLTFTRARFSSHVNISILWKVENICIFLGISGIDGCKLVKDDGEDIILRNRIEKFDAGRDVECPKEFVLRSEFEKSGTSYKKGVDDEKYSDDDIGVSKSNGMQNNEDVIQFEISSNENNKTCQIDVVEKFEDSVKLPDKDIKNEYGKRKLYTIKYPFNESIDEDVDYELMIEFASFVDKWALKGRSRLMYQSYISVDTCARYNNISADTLI
ncbi:hypothetical protein KY290_038423 [Solanum tuberosum]|uniref:Ulp1 protease family, C-terminal catalytic domain containing protein n=1 Tax=Solanum tuberosum TaxID=4113 RepID=A0ABQ7TZW2_SOLTU|nr:hypothetical protein KY290_038423 [Solanum tuberosum]